MTGLKRAKGASFPKFKFSQISRLSSSTPFWKLNCFSKAKKELLLAEDMKVSPSFKVLGLDFRDPWCHTGKEMFQILSAAVKRKLFYMQAFFVIDRAILT